MNNKLETISNLFEDKEIRSVWDSEKEEYYFSVIDVISALTESDDPSHYWRTLKSRMIKEGNETVTNCDTFKLETKDGKMRNTDMLDTKGIFRLIESVPSQKAEPFKLWLTQKMLSTLYKVEVNTINYHIKKIYSDNELTEDSTIRKFRIVQNEGNRSVSRDVVHYNLQMIITLGFKVDNERAVQFRKWANEIVKEYTIKGFAMDDERLKNSGSILTEKYFDELLERIREIRLSERRFYQKVTDIYATSIDYDRNSKTTIEFFEKVQNKMHYAVIGNTAAEIIYNRADAEHMGLTNLINI